MSGCATVEVPEASRGFHEYEVPEADAPLQPLPMPAFESGTAEVGGQVVATLVPAENDKLDQYVEAAEANAEALRRLGRAYVALQQENASLVEAGRSVEGEAALFRQIYLNEANKFGGMVPLIIGAGGVVLILLGAGL